MGFPSPAMDYVERQLSPVVLCHIKPEKGFSKLIRGTQ